MENFMGGSAAARKEAGMKDEGVTVPNGDGAGGAIPRGLEDSPSGLGGDGVVSGEAAARAAMRDRLGRFLPGNLGGPGNPHARRVALLRTVFLDRIRPDKLAVLVDEMYDMARNGDAAMAKLLFSYLLGKPSAAGDPDRIEVDEWKLRQEQPRLEEVEADQERLPAVLANETGQRLDPVKEQAFFAARAAAPNAKPRRDRHPERAARRRQKKAARRRRKPKG